MELSGLKGKVAIVSGASRGVGRAYALALAEAGATVVATARSLEGDPARPGSLAELVATAAGLDGEVCALGCDVEDEADIVRAVRTAVANFGGVDVLVNNAVSPLVPFETLDVSEAAWSHTMSVNVRAPYVFMREAVPHMIARGGGSIVNITAAAAGQTKPGTPPHDGRLVYGVSKAALERLTTFFAAEYAHRNIAANAVSPGHVTSYMMRSKREPDRLYWGGPIVFLARQRADGVTGQVFHTYEFGRSWGPRPEAAPQWDEFITALLRENGIVG